jgi:hypothetical protein
MVAAIGAGGVLQEGLIRRLARLAPKQIMPAKDGVTLTSGGSHSAQGCLPRMRARGLLLTPKRVRPAKATEIAGAMIGAIMAEAE